MRSKLPGLMIIGAMLLLVSSCISRSLGETQDNGVPNPASVYCVQNGGSLELRTDTEGAVEGVCVFPDGSECDEWAYFRDECTPAGEKQQSQPTEQPEPSPVPTVDSPSEFSSEDYQGWWTYRNEDYRFTLMLPEDWMVDELYSSDPLMSGHFLKLHPRVVAETDLNMRLSFRRKGEETLLWPTGIGAGEFVPLGTLDMDGQLLRRIGFQCPNGKINMIWYHGPEETGPNIQVGELEFGLFAYVSTEYCRESDVIGEKQGRFIDMIVASLEAD